MAFRLNPNTPEFRPRFTAPVLRPHGPFPPALCQGPPRRPPPPGYCVETNSPPFFTASPPTSHSNYNPHSNFNPPTASSSSSPSSKPRNNNNNTNTPNTGLDGSAVVKAERQRQRPQKKLPRSVETQTEWAESEADPLQLHCSIEISKRGRRGYAAVQTQGTPKPPSFADILAGKVPARPALPIQPQTPTKEAKPPNLASTSKGAEKERRRATKKSAQRDPEAEVDEEEKEEKPKPPRGVLLLSKEAAAQATKAAAETEPIETKPKVKSRNTPSGPVPLGEMLFAQMASAAKKPPPPPVKAGRDEPKTKPTPSNPLASAEVVYHKGKQRQEAKKSLTTLRKNIRREEEAKKAAAEVGGEGCGTGTISDAPVEEDLKDSEDWRALAKACVSKSLNEDVLGVVGELRRFQDKAHAKDPNKARLKRRLICGLREAAKHLTLGKAQLLILAPNLQGHAVLDEKMRALIRLAVSSEVPYVFALNRRGLGKVLCKPSPVSALVVLNHQGAEAQFRSLLQAREELLPLILLFQQLILAPPLPPTTTTSPSLPPQEEEEEEETMEDQ